MAAGRKIDKSLVEEMARLRGEGLSIRAIATAVNLDPRRVSEHLIVRGVRSKSKIVPSSELQKKRDEGMFVREISKLYGISMTVIKLRTTPPKNKIKRTTYPHQSSEEEREAIRELRRSNLSITEISKKTGRSLSLVKEVCAGIVVERKNLDTKIASIAAENKKNILALRAEGKTIDQICAALSLSDSTVKVHLRSAGLPGFDVKIRPIVEPAPKPDAVENSEKPAAPKKDKARKAFIQTAIGIAVGSKTKLSIPDHVRRMRDSLVMSRGYSETEALSQAMSFYARGKVSSRDDDYQPRKLVIRRRR